METCRNTPFDLPRLDPGVEVRLAALERRLEERQKAFESNLWWRLESRVYGLIVATVSILTIGLVIWKWR